MAKEKFQVFKKGEAPSLLDTQRANDVQDACAAFESMTVIPQGAGSFVVNGRSATLTLTPGDAAGTGPALPVIVLTLSKNGDPTDYNVNGEEA